MAKVKPIEIVEMNESTLQESPPQTAFVQSKFTPLPFYLERINAILANNHKQLVIVYDVEDGELFDAYVVDL